MRVCVTGGGGEGKRPGKKIKLTSPLIGKTAGWGRGEIPVGARTIKKKKHSSVYFETR